MRWLDLLGSELKIDGVCRIPGSVDVNGQGETTIEGVHG